MWKNHFYWILLGISLNTWSFELEPSDLYTYSIVKISVFWHANISSPGFSDRNRSNI